MLTIAWLAVLVAAPAGPARAAELEPLMAGWERLFSVTWEQGLYRGKPALQGYVNNVSPYSTTNIRIMVERLNAAGQVASQEVAWVPGELRGGNSLAFQVPTAPAPNYRVRVFSFDRVELQGGDFN
jgi:hypothetical protein